MPVSSAHCCHPTPVAAALALALTLALTACGGDDDPVSTTPLPGSGDPTANKPIVCKDYDNQDVLVKPKTITIRNNSEGPIYPVLATSMNLKNEWVMACQRTNDLISTDAVYKLYVNDGQGIPPGSEVTITLPLYSELSPGKYVTWWNGGRVLLADRNKRLRDSGDKAMDTPASVSAFFGQPKRISGVCTKPCAR